MTAKITIERTSPQLVRVTLVADIQIAGSLLVSRDPGGQGATSAAPAPTSWAGGASEHELLTVDQTQRCCTSAVIRPIT